MTFAEALQQAVQLHQSGDLTSAEALYREILRASPDHPDACHLLGVLLGQRGNTTEAVDLIRRAIAANPHEAMFYNNLGNLLRERKQLPAAADAFAKAIELRPSYFEAHNNLGNVRLDLGDPNAAADSYRHALSLNPEDARLTINLGSALLAAGRTTDALGEYRRAIQLDPKLPLGFNNYGVALLQAGQTPAALVALQRAVELQPDSVDHQIHLAAALRQAGRFEQAKACCDAALAINPDSPEAYNTLANVLADLNQTHASVQASQKAIALRPIMAEAHANLGVGLGELHQFSQSIAAFEEALRLSPNFAEGHRNLGLLLLTLGQFERGWREYEWRWQSPSFRQHACNMIPCPAPRWDGSRLNGRVILIQAEQGLGDTIQFARYVPLVAERGGTVIISAPQSLHRLLSTVRGVQRVVTELSETDAAAIDVQCPLMSLPLTLGLFEPLRSGKYLSVAGSLSPSCNLGIGSSNVKASDDLETLPRRSAQVHDVKSKVRVGLVWAGNPKLRTDPLRSITLSRFEPVLRCVNRGVDFFSLQLGPAAAQRRSPLIDMTQHITDFADTAALVEQLDLVIAVDTAVAHLSAALCKPTWVLIPHIADWRWQLRRSDSPWYPSMRLFRQTTSGDWTEPIQQVAEALMSYVPS